MPGEVTMDDKRMYLLRQLFEYEGPWRNHETFDLITRLSDDDADFLTAVGRELGLGLALQALEDRRAIASDARVWLAANRLVRLTGLVPSIDEVERVIEDVQTIAAPEAIRAVWANNTATSNTSLALEQ